MRREEEEAPPGRAAGEGPSVRDEVAELRALILEQQRQRAMIQPHKPYGPGSASHRRVHGARVVGGCTRSVSTLARRISSAEPPTASPAVTVDAAAVVPIPTYGGSSPAAIRPSAAGGRPQSLARGGARVLAGGDPSAPPPAPNSVPSSPTGRPRMFGSPDPNPAATAPPHGAGEGTREFGSVDPNLAGPSTTGDDVEMEVEGTQRPGDTSIPNLIDEPMHDSHAEVGLGQRPDIQPLNEQVAAEGSKKTTAAVGYQQRRWRLPRPQDKTRER